MESDQKVPYWQAFLPVMSFIVLLTYGLFIHPRLFGGAMLPLETILLILITLVSFFYLALGYQWEQLQAAIVRKASEAIPFMLILFSIGVLIGSWIVSGTIPMLIYYGVQLVHPSVIYLFGFGICILFSLLTGTSWGSAGTIGVVVMGIAQLYEANLAIAAAAVIGGAFFGDKLSPLSDTTNVAALATGVDVYDHIRSMLYTTGPAALIAAGLYLYFSLQQAGDAATQDRIYEQVEIATAALKELFHFNVLLLVPLLVIIWAMVTRKPIILALLGSSFIAMLLAMLFQPFSIESIFTALSKGFSTEMAPEGVTVSGGVTEFLNRGGLYNLTEGVVICFLIFVFIGLLEMIDGINRVIEPLLKSVHRVSTMVASTLVVTLITNWLTSNQYATSFIVGAAYNKKYDELKVDRRVLSRSLEDAGTMMENFAPWHPSGIFMAQTLGVAVYEYVPWQFLSWGNILIAFFFAFTGIAIFRK